MASDFFAHLPTGIKLPLDTVGDRILREYGAVFVTTACKPPAVIFRDEAEVRTFQSSVVSQSASINGISIELQQSALESILQAIGSANASGLTITPRGEDSSRRSYAETVALWKSRVGPGLAHWTGKGRITPTDAARITALLPFEQVCEIFKLEEQGIFFAKDLSKSIIYSVAPPGTSQHLSMLALDVTEHADTAVRSILAKHGWYQTVVSDLPHFTFLGVPESELPVLELKKVNDSGRDYWLPAI